MMILINYYAYYDDFIPMIKDQRPARFLVKCQFVKLKLTGTNWSTAANEFCCSVLMYKQYSIAAGDRCDHV